MELSQNDFMEELLEAPRRDSSWANFPTSGANEFFSSGWNFDSFDDNPSFLGFSTTPAESTFDCHFTNQTYPFADGFTVYSEIGTSFPPQHQECPSMADEEDPGLLATHSSSKLEMEQAAAKNAQVFTMGLGAEMKNKSRKLEGQPSKNLMAERRRRKRLNDRLSMLRSIVPKISKMDRTSILGDTIDYVKELLERINKLQEEEEEDDEEEDEEGSNKMHFFKDLKPNEVLVRNSPQFNVERGDTNARINICCSAKPGLLLSTVNTLEALGLEIQQCVISCFNDFSLQASCSEAAEQRKQTSPEDIKQALFRNAGYGGRCL